MRFTSKDPLLSHAHFALRGGMLVAGSLLALCCAVRRPVAPTAPAEQTPATVARSRWSTRAAPSTSEATRAQDAGTAESDAKPSVNSGANNVANAACPEGMVHVRHEFCPELERTCLREEYERSNHLKICHQFEPGSGRCLAPRVPLDFCIDRYEFPNQKGAHPPVMVDFHDAKAACAALGKRLCYEREWTAACEGPEEIPFPYGWTRSSTMCNFDNRWIEPSLSAIYSKSQAVRDRELARLDQSVPSGRREGCVSGFGVYDLTGNFDEWALADQARPRTKGKDAALKGGAWGHVRNACRPVTTSHAPEFRYYFVSFRCCADVPTGTVTPLQAHLSPPRGRSPTSGGDRRRAAPKGRAPASGGQLEPPALACPRPHMSAVTLS